jgi:hypothetical protein
MKSLSELREVLGGLQSQVNECMNFLERLAPLEEVFGGTTRRKSVKRANGTPSATLREQVKEHFRAQRNIDVSYPPNPSNITIQEAARVLNLTEAAVRSKMDRGQLHRQKEIRQTKTGPKGISYPREVFVLDKREVEALARAMSAGTVVDTLGRPVRRADRGQPVIAQRPQKRLSKIAQQRQLSADYLAQFDRDTPRTSHNRLTGALVRRGYLRKKGDGYVRSSKPFDVMKKKATTREEKPSGTYAAAAKAKREATAVLLGKFDTNEVRPSSMAEKSGSLGVLVTRGYLRKKDGGYVRTAKEFHP